MATALTDDLTRVSVADIEKWEEDGDTLYVYGKCTTPEIDTDDQVVSSEWSGPALKEYMAVAPTVRVQHNAQRDPAGSAVRVDVNRDGDGSHWLKAAVDEPVAQRLVKRGHLRAFSVGIARPVIERDISGKARGGIIKGGKIVEVSLVDSPANRSCFLEIAKSAADGTPEFTGKLVGADDAIQKALGAGLTKAGDTDTWTGNSADISRFGFPEDLSVTFTPDDMARLMQSKFVEKHYSELAAKAVTDAERAVYKRDIDTATRRRLASQGHALPDGSYPIENAGDLHNAAILARSGHGDAAGAKRLIAREARERGVANPLDSDGKDGSDSKSKGIVTEASDVYAGAQFGEPGVAAAKEADPDLTKDPEDGEKPKPVKKAKKKPKGPKKLPPWLNKPADGDGKGGDPDDDGACKSVTDHLWAGIKGTSDIECSKCHTTPAQAAGVTASPMDPAPVGELQESSPPSSVKGATPQSAGGVKDAPAMSPVPAHREPDGAEAEAFEADSGMSDGDSGAPNRLEAPTLKASPEVLALLRFKSIGIDPELGRLHDLTCPAFHPDEVAKFHPFAELAALIDEGAWARKALDAACGPIEHAIAMQDLMQAASALKAASEADVNDWRLEAHKAFRDANPGPGTYPAPGAVSPQKYKRPLITDGRSATSAGHSGPNTSPVVATMAPNASSFDRPPLSSGQTSPSPSFMKWDSGQYPSQQGVPTQLSYAHLEKDKQRMALVQMHDHLSRQFPEVCPLDTVDLSGRTDRPLRGVQPENHPVPPVAGIGKGAGLMADVQLDLEAIARNPATKAATPSVPVAAVSKAPAETGQFMDADIYKGFKKQRKKLGRKVLSGKMTVDEARSRLGRQFAQKASGDEGGAAAVYVTADPGMTPAAIKELQDSLNRLAGDPAWHMKVIVLPPGTRTAEPAQKSAVPREVTVAAPPVAAIQPVTLKATNFATDPEVIKSAVAEAVAPLAAELTSTKALLAEQQDAFTTKLAETQRVIDAIADQPDPGTAAFSGLAFQPVRKAARPAGVTDIAEAAARARRAAERELENLYESASDPFAREGFYSALNKVRGGAPNP